MQPRVSVIIPAYNAERFIENTLDSVLHQTYQDWECIVVDDGSTDRTPALLETYKDTRIRPIRQENAGVAAARNKGILHSRGEFVAFLDADDAYLPENIEKKIQYLDEQPEQILVHAREIIKVWPDGPEKYIAEGLGGHVLDELLALKQNVIHSPSSVIARKKALNKVGSFDQRFSTSADWELWTRLAMEGPIGYIPEPLSIYHLHQGQMHLNIEKMDSEMNLAFKELELKGAFKSKGFMRSCKARLFAILAASYLGHQKKIMKASGFLVKSLMQNPKEILNRIMN